MLGSPRPLDQASKTSPTSATSQPACKALLTESVVHICRQLQRLTGMKALSLAGGVALNCVANAAILEQTDFRDLYIQPAAGDNGTAIGAALWVEHQLLQQPRRFVMRHAYTGPAFDEVACAQALADLPWPVEPAAPANPPADSRPAAHWRHARLRAEPCWAGLPEPWSLVRAPSGIAAFCATPDART